MSIIRRYLPGRRRRSCSAFCDSEPNPEGRYGRGSEDPLSRVLVVTQPKAGTYLVAEILKHSGFHHTYLHLGENRLQAYDGYFLREGLFDPRKFDVACGIEESRKLIRHGEVAVSHLQYSSEIAEKLSGFRILHVKRELRTAFTSMSRMHLHSERHSKAESERIRNENIAGFMRHRGKNAIRNALSINKWARSSNVLSLKMETIASDPSQSINAMLDHVGHKPAVSAKELWQKARQSETLTKSIKYPALDWTQKDEEVFRSIGGPEANREMGYED